MERAGDRLRSGLVEQYELYGGTPPHEATATSLDAARRIRSCAATMRAKVLAAITRAGAWGATDLELEKSLGIIHQTCSARRRELVLQNRIVDSGERRHTRHGRTAIVWVVKV